MDDYIVSSMGTLCTTYKMEIGPYKVTRKNNDKQPQRFSKRDQDKRPKTRRDEELQISGISNEGPKPEILSRIAQTTAALSRLKPIWRDKSWALTAELERRTHALEMRCYRKLLNITYKDHATNGEVHSKIHGAIGKHGDHLSVMQTHKPRW